MPDTLDYNPAARRRLLTSVFVSFVILFAGVFWTYRFGLSVNLVDHQLYHSRIAVEELQTLAKQGAHRR